MEGSLAWVQTRLTGIRAVTGRVPIAARIVACVGLIIVELFVSRTSPHRERTLTTFDGGYFSAAFGSVVDISAARAGSVTVLSGNLEVGTFARCDIAPCSLQVLGDATYSVRGQVGLITVTVSKPVPLAPELVSGALLLLAALLAFLSVPAPTARSAQSTVDRWRPGAIAAGVAIAAALLFPPYLHNDQLGRGVSGDWGYLGWGYVDTVSSSMNMVTSDTGDPASIPSDGKTIVMPAIVALLGGWISAGGAAYFWSLVLTALTAAGIATLATLLWRNDYAGVAAGALFAVEPMTLGYALSFYQELGFVAAFTWGIFFAVTGVAAGSRARFIAGALLVSLAVCCKSPVLAVEIIFLTFALFLALGVSARTAAVVAVQYGALALLTAVATWPFLWVDTLQRVGYAFFARVVVDKTLHLSAPFVARAFNAVSQTVVHTGPVCTVLVMLSIAYLAREKRWPVLFGLIGAIAVGIGLVVPTSLYIEHYWFYVIPALPLLACAVVVPLTQRIATARLVRVALGGLIGAELIWALVFWPYPSSATLGCLSLECSSRHWGVGEPTYGLREAAAWIRGHTPDTAAIGTLTAPHILQDQVGGRFVRSLWMPPDAVAQGKLIGDSGVQYIVGNVWSQAAHDVPLTDVAVAWAGSQRDGSPVIYTVQRPGHSWLWPDAPAWQTIAPLVPQNASQIVAFPRQASYLGRVSAGRLVTPPQPQGAATPSPLTIMRINGGVLATTAAAPLAAALDLPNPLATDSNGDGVIALPSMASLEPARAVSLRNINSPYRGDHRLAAFLTPSKDAYALKYLYVSVHADTPAHTFGQMNGNVGLSCSFGKITSEYLTVISDHDSVAWVPMDNGYVGQCDPAHQRIAIAVDVFVPNATRLSVVATPEIDRSVPAALLGTGADTRLLSQLSDPQATSIAARDDLAPAGMIVPAASHEFDAVASKRIEIGSHAAFLAFLREPQGRPINPTARVYCDNGCSYKSASRQYLVGLKGRITWTWALESLADASLLRVDLSGVRPDMKSVLAGAFLSYGSKSCYTDLREFARNGFLYLNLASLRVGACAGVTHGQLGLSLFPHSAIAIDGVPAAYSVDMRAGW
jgi:hypothetical protein